MIPDRIQGGSPLKYKRTENGKVSSLADLKVSELAIRILSTSKEELLKLNHDSMTSIFNKLSRAIHLFNQGEQEKVILLFAEVVADKSEYKAAFKDFLFSCDNYEELPPQLDCLVDNYFLQKNSLYKSVMSLGTGANLGELLKFINLDDNANVERLIDNGMTFSFVNEKCIRLIEKAYRNLRRDVFIKLIHAMNPPRSFIEKWILNKENFLSNYELVDLIHLIEILHQLNREEIQSLYDLSMSNHKPFWAAFWIQRGAKGLRAKRKFEIPKITAPPDVALEALMKKALMGKKTVDQPRDFVGLQNLSVGALRSYKTINPKLYYYLLSKWVLLSWGHDTNIKNPEELSDYVKGFEIEITLHYWVQTLESFSHRPGMKWLTNVANVFRDTRNLEGTEKKNDFEDITKHPSPPIMMAAGSLTHHTVHIFSGNRFIYCDRDDGQRSGPRIFKLPQRIKKSKIKEVKQRNHEKGKKSFRENVVAEFYKAEFLSQHHMRNQKGDNCSLTSYDSAALALLIEMAPADVDARKLYKELTFHMRELSAQDAIQDADDYLKGNRDHEFDFFHYTHLAAIVSKIQNNPKYQSLEIIYNNCLHLMEKLEG
jgi:hypothetical protein